MSAEYPNSFWKEIPDHVLDELYNQFAEDEDDEMGISEEMYDTYLQEENNPIFQNMSGGSFGISGHPQMDENRNSQETGLFQTDSFTNVDRMMSKEEYMRQQQLGQNVQPQESQQERYGNQYYEEDNFGQNNSFKNSNINFIVQDENERFIGNNNNNNNNNFQSRGFSQNVQQQEQQLSGAFYNQNNIVSEELYESEQNIQQQNNNENIENYFDDGVTEDILEDWEKANVVLNQLHELSQSQESQLESLCNFQQAAINSRNKENAFQTQKTQYQLNQQIELELKELHQLNRSMILKPCDLNTSRTLGVRLQIQQQTIDLYRRELTAVMSDQVTPLSNAMLIITEQPVPQVIFKKKSMEEQFSLRLLTGAAVDLRNMSAVEANLVAAEETNNKPWKSNQPVSNNQSTMENYNRSCTFHNLTINVSTRMSMVNFRFRVQLETSGGILPCIESAPSFPFIVITNESQWCDAACKLLLFDAFASYNEIPWPQFANGVHIHFLKSTRQEPAQPLRPILMKEFNYIHKKWFKNSPTIKTHPAGRFWSWFGKVTQTIRFKRHISNLWNNYLIYGLVTKQETIDVLTNREPGTFLIRFSESYPGLFAVSYVDKFDSDDPIKHYLVKPEDTGSQKTLPDFIREKPQFLYLLQFDIDTHQILTFPKDDAFEKYYSKGRKNFSDATGYVLL